MGGHFGICRACSDQIREWNPKTEPWMNMLCFLYVIFTLWLNRFVIYCLSKQTRYMCVSWVALKSRTPIGFLMEVSEDTNDCKISCGGTEPVMSFFWPVLCSHWPSSSRVNNNRWRALLSALAKLQRFSTVIIFRYEVHIRYKYEEKCIKAPISVNIYIV